MNWSIDDIEKNLLGQKACVIAIPPDVIVDAVNRVETILGHDWILAEMKATGIAPAMTVIGMGLRLATLHGLANTETLLSNLRRRDQNAEAELTALYLIRGQDSSIELELEPLVGARKADFRVRKAGESVWTESSHKYTAEEIFETALRAGFRCQAQWIDEEWPFAENLLVAE